MGRFTCPDPLGDTGGDHDLYDYCVDDPVNCVDPEGLNPFMSRFVAKRIGSAIASMFVPGMIFPAQLNADEQMIDVRNNINNSMSKIKEGKGSLDDLQTIKENAKKEDKLWDKYGHIYMENSFYDRYFPDREYMEKKKRDSDLKKNPYST